MTRWLSELLIKLINSYLFEKGDISMMAPVANTPRFNVLLTADAGREYGMADNITVVAISFVNTPVGYAFRMWDLRSSGWKLIADEDDITTASNYSYGGDLSQMVSDIKAMGVDRFIELRVAPWATETLVKHFAGKVVGIVNAPGEVPTEITTLNIAQALNAALMGFQWQDKIGNNGVPELYKVA